MGKLFLQVLILGILTLGAAAIHYWYLPGEHRPVLYLENEPLDDGEINMARVRQLEAAGGVLWIDARERSEFDKEHVPGALLLNPNRYEDLVAEMFELLTVNEKPIVIYCDAQKCAASRKVAEKLEDLGVASDIHVLRGGWNAWKAASAP